MCRIGRPDVPLPYSRNVSADVWIGALTTLGGGLLGGAISLALGRQQARETRLQRQEEDAREQLRRSADRRFQAYADFLTGARSFRNAVEAYYLHPRHKPSLAALDALVQAANDASALVFLVVESDGTYQGCREVLRSLWRARAVIHGIEPAAGDPWPELNRTLGRATREFQNAARAELGVTGPAEPWDSRDQLSPEGQVPA